MASEIKRLKPQPLNIKIQDEQRLLLEVTLFKITFIILSDNGELIFPISAFD
jgi:hypothetical protein